MKKINLIYNEMTRDATKFFKKIKKLNLKVLIAKFKIVFLR